jgi:hypothetical protein
MPLTRGGPAGSFRDYLFTEEPPMSELYASAPIAIRDGLAAAHDRAWARIGRPGTWWDGPRRVAIAAETRHAPSCALCRRRKEALSPAAIEGKHDSLGALPETVVEVVHRVRTDPARLNETWVRTVIAAGLSAEQYVETVSIVAHVVAIDTMARGLGVDALPLPQPMPGLPSHYRPAGAKLGGAWVPWLEPADLTKAESALYPAGRPAANIMKAMSLVPDEVKSFFDVVSHQYQGPLAMRDFSSEYRAISHAQIELLAARVSALNQCLY